MNLLPRSLRPLVALSVLFALAAAGCSTLPGQASQLARQGRFAEAMPLAEQVLTARERTLGPEHPDTRASRRELAQLHIALGRHEQALSLAVRALEIQEQASGPDHPETGTSLNVLAGIYQSMGQYDKALPLFNRALAIHEKSLGREDLASASSLNNLAGIYRDLGRYDKALPLYGRALAIHRRILGSRHPSTGSSLSNLGGLLYSMGQSENALPLAKWALEISDKAWGSGHPITGRDMNSLGQVYQSLGQYDKALTLTLQALTIQEKALGPEHPATGISVSNLAGLYLSMEQYDKAVPLYIRALAIAERAGRPELVWKVHGSFMELHGRRRSAAPTLYQPALAIWFGKQAVNTLQTVRGRMKSLDQASQASFVKKNERTYQTLANLLIETGRITEAEQVLAMLKERELSELVRSEASRTQADYVGVEQRVLAEQRRLAAARVKDATELEALERRIDAGEALGEDDRTRHGALMKAAETWRADYQRFMFGLSQSFAEAARGPATQSADMQSTRLQARVALDPDGALGLHYVVTDDRVGIIVATASGSFGRFTDIPRAELNRQISALRRAIVNKADTRHAAQALWQMLIQPVHADIQAAQPRTLVLSLTDTLRYLPFAALQDPLGRYLVEDHALALWAAAADANPTASTAGWRVAALGLTQAREGFSALPGVRRELNAIVRTAGSDTGVLPGRIALDEQFNRGQFEAALNGQTNVVHVASHFDFRPGDESGSVLLIGQGESISLGQLAVMNFRRVEQLTLSACDTATGGGTNENGAEVEGLAAVVLRQQAKAVLATLWKVADDSTASLMREFYAQRAQDHPSTRAQALRQAQLGLLNGPDGGGGAARGARAIGADGRPIEATLPPIDPSRPWAHPYYWAPFVLSGSWL